MMFRNYAVKVLAIMKQPLVGTALRPSDQIRTYTKISLSLYHEFQKDAALGFARTSAGCCSFITPL
jgi:hypothetical protein